MEATIQFNKMDVNKEEARPKPEVSNLPQERHIWRMPKLPPFPKKFINAKTKIGSEQPKKRSGKYAQAFDRAHELLLTHQELSGSGEDNRTLRGLDPIILQRKSQKINDWLNNQSLLSIDQKKEFEMNPVLETEGPVASTRSRSVQRQAHGPQKKSKGPKNHQRKGKGKANWHILTHKGTGFPNWSLQPWTVSSIWPGLLWSSQPKSRKV
ncbi:hypothetical protein O181_100458 [Austropuccinia psidii MF-1]|uniref:Uncharacterized protein n=1 Tax=Austropuccinia psidii MF-1 TaxID=1389203 RepID=A0A9Q3JEP2_9BASI|nr:hypothetical protein [Austropuccinia psidii MF-1]